jgi:anti-sigma regulatory factor (Ser/Thr protein kinase)
MQPPVSGSQGGDALQFPVGALPAVGAGAAWGPGVPAAPARGTAAARLTVPPSGYQGAIILSEWRLRDTLELAPLPGAAPCARLHARHVLWEWGLARLGKDAELLVAELVTNAVAASQAEDRPSPVRLWLLTDQARALILVWDASSRPPVPAQASADAENGRGLLLVQALSQRWDWYVAHERGGKVVWALTQSADAAQA